MAWNALPTSRHRRASIVASVALAAVNVVVLPEARGAVPLIAQAGQALVAPGLDQAAKPVAAGQPADQPAEPAAAQPAGSGEGEAVVSHVGILKYLPTYVLMVLVLGLALFIICRPPPRGASDK